MVSRRSALERSLGIFSSRISTPRCRAKRLELSSAEKAASIFRMSNSSPPTPMCWIRYWKGMVSAISSARLISSTICRRRAFTGFGDADDGSAARSVPRISSLYMGECSECSLQLGIAEPVAQFRDLRLIAIIQVLARAERSPPREFRPAGSSASSAVVSRWLTNRCVESTWFIGWSMSFRRAFGTRVGCSFQPAVVEADGGALRPATSTLFTV